MRRRLPILAWFALALLWGSEWMLTASLPAEPPLLSLAIRYAVAAALLLPWAIRGRIRSEPPRRLLSFALIGAGLLALPQIMLAASANGISPAWSLLALAAVPVLLAIGGHGEITTAVCGFAGVVLLLAGSLTIRPAQLPWLLFPLGGAVVLAWALVRAMAMLEGLPASALGGVLCLQCAVGAVLTAAAAAVLEQQPMLWSGASFGGVLASALFATAAAYILFYWLLRRLGPAKLGMLQWVQLLVAVAESALLTRVRPGWEFLASVLLLGVALGRAFLTQDDERGVMLQITGQ